jgi:hypothetical protein
MYSQRAQVPVLKQGRIETGSWSTRVLTIDVASGTVTISRHNHPNNVLYHSLHVSQVLMWPHFGQKSLEDPINSLNAKMTLRIVGKVVPVPQFSAEVTTTIAEENAVQLLCNTTVTASTATVTPEETHATPSTGSSAPPNTSNSTSVKSPYFTFTVSDSAKKSRSTPEGAHGEKNEAWMIRFTTFKSYELTLALLQTMSNAGVTRKQLFGPQLLEDFMKVKKAWGQYRGIEGLDTEGASLM